MTACNALLHILVSLRSAMGYAASWGVSSSKHCVARSSALRGVRIFRLVQHDPTRPQFVFPAKRREAVTWLPRILSEWRVEQSCCQPTPTLEGKVQEEVPGRICTTVKYICAATDPPSDSGLTVRRASFFSVIFVPASRWSKGVQYSNGQFRRTS